MGAEEQEKSLKNTVFGYSVNVNHLEDENRILRETTEQLRAELDKFKQPPLLIAEVKDILKDKIIVRLNNGNEFLVNASKECKGLKQGCSVLVEQKNLTVIKPIPTSKIFNVEKFVIIEKPCVKWEEVGGLITQTQEIKEVIELPLKKPELFRKVGIHPPKGILLYGPPGTGKTLLAKAVATSTKSTFIEIVGSELVQKFIGEGAKLVKEVFNLAKEKAPSIIFIDELDALASRRVDIGTSGEREVQRTFMQLLAEIDGFKPLGNVKVIGCTNRRDILDPAILRPGRLDRLIMIPLPDKNGIKEVFKIHTKNMQLDKKINLKKVYDLMYGFSGAELKAVTTESGYFAIRKNRTKIVEKDIIQAIKKIKGEEKTEEKNYFG